MAYDPTSPEVLANPAAAYEHLREQCPVHRFDGLGRPMYTLARTEDVRGVLTDPGTWSNRHGPGVGFSPPGGGDMQHEDPPEHEVRRRFARSWFLPRNVSRLEPRLRELAGDLVDGFAADGAVDLHDAFALPLPVISFTELMGIPDEHRDQFKAWADELVLAMTYPDAERGARKALADYARAQIQLRRDLADAGESPPAGLLTHLATADYVDGRMPIDEVVSMVSQMLVAGHETTTSLITNLLWRLLDVPERWARLVAEPELVPNAVEESLRYDPPVLGLCRTNNHPVRLHGTDIPADSKVMILYASPNRDPALFDAPDSFQVDRPLLDAKRHFTFGWGIHHCLGSHLARLTGRVALATLLERIPTLELDGEPMRIGAPFLWGRGSLPVRFE